MVYITISDTEGVVLDRFLLTHWKDDSAIPEESGADFEAYGSHGSNALLVDRITQGAERSKP